MQPPPAPPPVETPPNRFGVFRRYTTAPQNDPEEGISFEDFADATSHLRPRVSRDEINPLRPFGSSVQAMLSNAKSVAADSYAPFLNWTVFKMMEWQYNGSMTKSTSQMQRLVDDVLLDDRFEKEDLRGFSAKREKQRLDDYSNSGGPFNTSDGWYEGEVVLHLPKTKVKHVSEGEAPTATVSGIFTRKFVEVIKAAFKDPIARKYHWFPHWLFRTRSTPQSPHAPPERMVSDIYNSDALIKEHEELQAQPRNPEDAPSVEYVVAPILLYSDSTHLTNFGTASMWPVYAYFGCLTKYLRLKPSTYQSHHVAYIPSVGVHSSTLYRHVC